MSQSPAQFIEDTGTATIAERLQKREGTVRTWKSRNRLPRSAWPELLLAFPDLTVERLKAIEALSG